MLQLILVVFAGAFLVTALLLAAAGAGASQQRKATLARLDSVSVTSKEAILDETAIIKRDDLLSPIPWLDRWLRTMDIFGRVRLLLEQADVKWTAGGLLFASLGCAVLAAAAVYLRTGAVFLSVVLALMSAFIPWLYLLHKRRRRFGAFEAMLPEALDLMVSALRAGHALATAIGTVAKEMGDPIAKEFRQCFDEQNFGLELKAAMLNLAEHVPIHDVRIIVTAVLVQKESGGNLAEVLDKVAAVIRERFRLKRQIRVHTAQGRLTGWILACLPPVLGCAMYFVKPEYMSVLWTTPGGVKMLYGATIMMVIGALIIRKIVRVRV